MALNFKVPPVHAMVASPPGYRAVCVDLHLLSDGSPDIELHPVVAWATNADSEFAYPMILVDGGCLEQLQYTPWFVDVLKPGEELNDDHRADAKLRAEHWARDLKEYEEAVAARRAMRP